MHLFTPKHSFETGDLVINCLPCLVLLSLSLSVFKLVYNTFRLANLTHKQQLTVFCMTLVATDCLFHKESNENCAYLLTMCDTNIYYVDINSLVKWKMYILSKINVL